MSSTTFINPFSNQYIYIRVMVTITQTHTVSTGFTLSEIRTLRNSDYPKTRYRSENIVNQVIFKSYLLQSLRHMNDQTNAMPIFQQSPQGEHTSLAVQSVVCRWPLLVSDSWVPTSEDLPLATIPLQTTVFQLTLNYPVHFVCTRKHKLHVYY